jgi:PAS domain S-box-containing protein
MVAMVLLTATAVGLLNYRSVAQSALPRALDRIDAHARVIAVVLKSAVGSARADVVGFRYSNDVIDIMTTHLERDTESSAGAAEAEWRRRLAQRFVAELTAKANYAQLRLIGIDDGGRELVRVDRSGPDGAIRIVPDSELLRKADRDYFKHAILLPADEIYISPIDLHRKNGIVEIPPIPTLRAAAPIYTPTGKPFGIVIINVDLREAFSHVRSTTRTDAKVYLVNERGDYLVNPDQSRAFGFEFGTPFLIQDNFPTIAGLLTGSATEPSVVRDRAGGYFGVALNSQILAGGPLVTVVETLPYSILMAAANTVRDSSLTGGLAAILVAIAIAIVLARSLTSPLVHMTRTIEGFSRGQSIAVPAGGGREIRVLATAFADMAVESRQKAAALKQEQEKFRLAVEASPSGLVMIDDGGSIVLINAETERLFGYDRHELIGQKVDILVPPRLRRNHVEQRSKLAAQPEARPIGARRDLYGLRKDGTEFPVEIGLNPIRTDNVLLILSVIVDISERKRAEATLREYAERELLFIAAVESSNDAIVTKTLDGVITGWNNAAERLFGFTSMEAIGKRIDIIVPAELLNEVTDILSKIRNGQKVDHHETVRTHKNGNRIDISLSVSPVKSQSGVIIGAAKVARDITARKSTDEALRNSEQMAREIIAGALDGFVQVKETGEVTEWNPRAEEMFGWLRGEALGKRLSDLILPEGHRPRHHEMFEQLTREVGEKGGIGERTEYEAVRKDGRKIRVESTLTALRRPDGYVFNGFIRDLTDKIAADEQLRQAQKMESVGQLTGGIAHDFNNMLTVITGTIDILAEAVADKPQLAAIAKLISEAADRGAELTGHLLAFARKQPLQPREIDVNALLIESEKLLRPTLGEHVEIKLGLQATAWPALADPTQLTTALLNLAVNARDAMPGGGKLTLETSNTILDQSYAEANADVRPGHYLLIAVSDCGGGIPEAIREKVFEPFFTTKEVGKGTGLGLSMVYGFVKQSGGHIKVYSETGHGTTFKIYLPRASAQPEPIAETSQACELEGGAETILVVEDDTLVRGSVIAQLQSLGYRTLSAANGVEALAVADCGAAFDLLFTDLIMPGPMNGRQLAEEMAKLRSPLKVLFTSGYTENMIIHHGRLDAGVLLLAKPYRKPDLARMVRRALGVADSSPVHIRKSLAM